MVALSQPLVTGLTLFTTFVGVLSLPPTSRVATIKRLLGRDTFEWTALGDSYSSGVGAGDYIDNSYRCLRYSQAYPGLIDSDGRLPGGEHTFHNTVCSGSSTADVQLYQFYDEDTSGKPNWQYGTRPRFGEPSMASLSVGGNDIDFPGIIFNCILEWSSPLGIPVKTKTCDEQREITWNLLVNPNLSDKIDQVIKMTVAKGRQGPVGDAFKLFVTGFPQFFSTETNECDTVTFARSANPVDDGKEHTKLTQDLRKEFNSMSVYLNQAIATAVSRNVDQGVTWVPIDGAMEGHRFCEPGVAEPDQTNPNLWLYHYPYNQPEDATIDGLLLNAYNNISTGVDINSAYPTYQSFQNALFDAVQIPGDPSQDGSLDWVWKPVGNRVKVFHPQVPLHEAIRDLVLDAYIKDLGYSPSPAQDQNACHGVGGDYWVMSRDVAIDNVNTFCSQTNQNVTYNQGSVNELLLSVSSLSDSSKGPADAPDCVGRFQGAVIDGCDGNDPVNNPHNYKFGSTLTTADGWEYTMTPLSQQVNQVSCDVSYKFFFDEFQVRGKNLPDGLFGANGEGLHDQLNGCGALTDWNFERTPDDPTFQWYASGHLPIGTKKCVGSALESAGGSGDGNCHGAGKRSTGVTVRQPSGIEAWPGYGDDSKHIFKHPALSGRDSINLWPGYGDDSKHVFGHSGTD